MKLVYLAEPIDQANGVWHGAHLAAALRVLPDVAVYQPARAFSVGELTGVDRRLESVNRVALEAADAMVAVVPAGVPTLGVPREIEAFSQTGKPWVLVTDLHRSFSLADAPFTVGIGPDAIPSVVSWIGGLPESEDGYSPMDLIFSKDGDYDGQLPTRVYRGDAGYDLYAATDVHVPWNSFRDVPCGVKIALPEGLYGRIVGRSSTLRKRNLIVSEGIIDTGWRGPLFAGVRNLGAEGETIRAGERIAQLILTPNVAPSFRPVWASATEFDAIPHDGRGANGFGSSGS